MLVFGFWGISMGNANDANVTVNDTFHCVKKHYMKTLWVISEVIHKQHHLRRREEDAWDQQVIYPKSYRVLMKSDYVEKHFYMKISVNKRERWGPWSHWIMRLTLCTPGDWALKHYWPSPAAVVRLRSLCRSYSSILIFGSNPISLSACWHYK